MTDTLYDSIHIYICEVLEQVNKTKINQIGNVGRYWVGRGMRKL